MNQTEIQWHQGKTHPASRGGAQQPWRSEGVIMAGGSRLGGIVKVDHLLLGDRGEW